MPNLQLENISIRGLTSVVPKNTETIEDLEKMIGHDTAVKISKATGIVNRRIATAETCISDLMEFGAKSLLDELNWSPESVDVLIVVTQTADYRLPANACLIQNKLKLSKNAIVFDINLGCSGYVFGLFNIASIMQATGLKRALLLVGDTTSHFTREDDRSIRPLFGDAASITALEYDKAAAPMKFNLGSDGSGAPYLIVKDGGMRTPSENKPELFMDGTQVFAFTLREIPKNIAEILDGKDISEIDKVVLHQANSIIIDKLGQKINASPDQLVKAMENYGNTSSASIPLAISCNLADEVMTSKKTILMSGFGVGWSWGSAIINFDNLSVCNTIEYEDGS
jgi:3-oxoacyl-[acyl-carrier-protein] synthase-3